MNNAKIIWVGILIAIVIAIGGYLFPQQVRQSVSEFLGAVGTRFPNGLAVGSTATVTQNKLTVGNSGTAQGQVNFGTCYLDPYAATIVATSSASVSCQSTLAVDAAMAAGSAGGALTGITSNSICTVSLSTTTAGNTWGGIRINGQSASTTAGQIELKIGNATGATFTWPVVSGTASGTATYYCATP